MTYQIIDEIKTRMDKVISHFESDLTGIRTGQANVSMLDRVEVDYYGSMTPINQIAGISIVEGRTFVIKPYDSNSLKDIEKAINVSDLGIAPQNDGSVIRLSVPALTGDTRKEMVKKVSKLAEEEKIAIRNIRRDANDATKKNKELTEDIEKDCLNEIQKVTDTYIKKIDEIAKAKEAEVLKV